jgi:hypothetical protein
MRKPPRNRAWVGVWGWLLGIAIGLTFGVAIGSAIDNVGARIAIGMGPAWVLGLAFSRAMRDAL